MQNPAKKCGIFYRVFFDARCVLRDFYLGLHNSIPFESLFPAKGGGSLVFVWSKKSNSLNTFRHGAAVGRRVRFQRWIGNEVPHVTTPFLPRPKKFYTYIFMNKIIFLQDSPASYLDLWCLRCQTGKPTEINFHSKSNLLQGIIKYQPCLWPNDYEGVSFITAPGEGLVVVNGSPRYR